MLKKMTNKEILNLSFDFALGIIKLVKQLKLDRKKIY